MPGIRYAWCHELDDIVTAMQAKREYLSLVPRPEKFHFFCANPHCLRPEGASTRITGVNYKKPASENEQSVIAHYR